MHFHQFYLGCLAHTPLAQLTVHELRDESPAILDVRRRAEFVESHVPGAKNIPLDELPERLTEVDRDHPLAVICARRLPLIDRQQHPRPRRIHQHAKRSGRDGNIFHHKDTKSTEIKTETL